MILRIPDVALVMLIGPSGAGKTTFARKHFAPTEILSSDYCRGMVCDEEHSVDASRDAFQVLHLIARKRLARGKLTVVDATNVQRRARKPLINIAHDAEVAAVAIVFNFPEEICQQRNAQRNGRVSAPEVVSEHVWLLQRTIERIDKEGFAQVHILNSPDQAEQITIERVALECNRCSENGPFDIIGDVHGCFDELCDLLTALGYELDGAPPIQAIPPEGRRAIFIGDLVDRGPDTPAVLRLVMNMSRAGYALCVPGNHDVKLKRALQGHHVQIKHGLDLSLEQLSRETERFRQDVVEFLLQLPSHYVFDHGRLVIAHAGLRERLQGRETRRVRETALFGERTGDSDEYGLPIRINWPREYRGTALVVYGHTPVQEPRWINNTINIDTGCVFGGRLTALRYPERELVSVPATTAHAHTPRPMRGLY